MLKNDRARAIRFSTHTAICEALGCAPGDLLMRRNKRDAVAKRKDSTIIPTLMTMSDERPMFRGRDGWLYRFAGRRIERVTPPAPPEEAAILERSRSLANHAASAVGLQAGRVRSKPEDPWHTLYDYEMLIGALSRFRNALLVAQHVPSVATKVTQIVSAFDESVPGLRKMRNVLEHLEDYGVDAHHFGNNRRGNEKVFRQQVQSSSWSPDEFRWLGETLHVPSALDAVSTAYAELKQVQASYRENRTER